jgi:hypothetical protein
MNSTFDAFVLVVLIGFTVMLWKASSHPATARWARIAMRVTVAFIVLGVLWNVLEIML